MLTLKEMQDIHNKELLKNDKQIASLREALKPESKPSVIYTTINKGGKVYAD